MRLHVFRQMIAPHEAFAALGAGEPLLARVCPQVPLQLVAPREFLAAVNPIANERTLASVPP